MKKILFLILFVSSIKVAFSQFEITGFVKDSLNNPIEFANIIFTNQHDEIIAGTISDAKGLFNLSINQGVYKIRLSYIGYENWEKPISVYEDQNFGTIILSKSKIELEEVQITAKKPLIEQKIDRLVFNVSESVFAKGKTALKTLELAPMVWVSSKGNITINGRGGARVIVNGKLLQREATQSYLNSLRSEDIQSIEIIPDPPAEYDAEVKSGIINII